MMFMVGILDLDDVNGRIPFLDDVYGRNPCF